MSKLNIKKLLTKILTQIKPVTPFTTRSVTQTQNITASNGATFNPTAPTVSGYTAVGVIGRGSNHGNSITMSASGLFSTYAYNRLTSAQSTTVTHYILYIKTSLLGGGYFISSLLSTIAHLAERRWRYVRHEETACEDSQGNYTNLAVRHYQFKGWRKIVRHDHSMGHECTIRFKLIRQRLEYDIRVGLRLHTSRVRTNNKYHITKCFFSRCKQYHNYWLHVQKALNLINIIHLYDSLGGDRQERLAISERGCIAC